MIDTVSLIIPLDNVRFRSDISSWDLYSRTDDYERYVRNPSQLEQESGNYFPRLTRYQVKYFKSANLRIEFSTPKLLFMNNLEELEDKDFPKIIDTLSKRLATMGVLIENEVLENSSVNAVHYSKNIQLEKGYTSSYLISEMNKVNLRKSFDVTRVRYINGQSLCAYTKSHQFIVYDKIADLKKDSSRAIDKDQTNCHKLLHDELAKEHCEIIRFEVRLCEKKKMNKVFEKLGYEKNLSFKQIFNSKLSMKIVSDYWAHIKKGSMGIFSLSLSYKDMLHNIFLSDSEIKVKQAVYLIGLVTLAKDEDGIGQLRSILSNRSANGTWYRFAADLRQANEMVGGNTPRSWVSQIDRELENYQPYKLKQ